MPKFSGTQKRPNVSSPMRTTQERGLTHEGGAGFKRDAKTELFLLAVTNMVREDTFYESAKDRDKRFQTLIHKVTQEDPAWVRAFIPYLRNTMQMRSASIVMAAEYVRAKGEKSRQVVTSAMSRADEPAEILAYWAQEYGKNFPQPLKRGVADAVEVLYTQRSALKYDGQSRAWRMGDVINIVHPKPLTAEQSALYKYLLDVRFNNEIAKETWEELPMLLDYKIAMEAPVEIRREFFRNNGLPTGMTWESLSGWLQGPMDAEAWNAVIPHMGYMALLRNLRNFEDAGISQGSALFVSDKISDPEEVAKSRQFPIRFYSAWKATDSLTWGKELEMALDYSVSNIPELSGRTLILVDTSGSMAGAMSRNSTVNRWEVAAVFGAALAKRNRGKSNLVVFQSFSEEIDPARSVLQTVDKIQRYVGGGTNTWQAVDNYFDGHDRIVIITDEQAHPYYGAKSYPVPVYTFNVAGYEMAHNEQGEKGSYVFGGLTDAGFVLLKAIDDLQNGSWPWEIDA